jgi:hypothetical protein
MKTSPYGGWSQRGQLRFEGAANRGCEPLWRLHDNVDHECAATKAELRALPIKISDGLLHLSYGALAHLTAVVQYAVDGSFTESGLHRYLANSVGMCHWLLLAFVPGAVI